MSTIAFSLVPAMGLWRQSLAPSIAAGGRGATISGGRSRARSILIGLEVAVSLTLLTGALLMTISALRMLAVDFGIQPGGVTTVGTSLRQQSYPDAATRAPFFERLIDRMSAMSQGRVVAMGDWWPLQAPPPRQFDAGNGSIVDGGAVGVSAGYFSALGVRILEGRPFSTADRFGSEPVVVASESLARRLWPSSDCRSARPFACRPCPRRERRNADLSRGRRRRRCAADPYRHQPARCVCAAAADRGTIHLSLSCR